MAQKSSSSSSKGSSKQGSKASAKNTAKKGTAKSKRQQPDLRLVDAGMRHDISGIIIIVIAVALFVCAVMPTTGVVAAFLSNALHKILGVGCYILPIVMVIIGVCFLIRFGEFRIPTRVAVGATLILLALLVILGLSTPGASEGVLTHFFEEAELVKRGGYVGAGLAWILCQLLGQVISIILMVGLAGVGLVIIGFSVSGLLDRIRSFRAQLAENRERDRTIVREQYKEAMVKRQQAAAKAAYPTSDFEYEEPGESGRFAASSAPTRILQKLTGRHTSDVPANTQLLADGNPAPMTPGQAAKTTAFTQKCGYGKPSSYLPPAVPIPAPQGYDDVDASTKPVSSHDRANAATTPGGQAQPMTRKLGRKDAAKTTEKDTAKNEAAQDPSMTSKLRLASEQEMGEYTLPPMDLLAKDPGGNHASIANFQAQQTAQLLQNTLSDFNVNIDVVGWVVGPTVTLYKLQLPAGMKVATIANLNMDLSRALMVDGIRIYSPVQGTPYVGIEVPNRERATVYLADVLKDAPEGPLQVAIGKNVDGKCIVSNLAKMPHLLIGGTTGSGKSIAMHGMIMSILMRATPDEVRFIMIDPKRVEFNHYEDIPHLYVPPVTDPKEASSALSWAVAEMELRLKKFQKVRARDILSYNEMVENGEIDVENATKLPYIVIVIDELADLMMNVGKEVEFSISRIAQLARAAGIHLIIATQRPDSNIVTGLIKANITNRIALKVSSGINSRVIIDQTGAENLIGKGDMLFQTTDSPKPTRIQGCWVSDKEIDRVVEAWKAQGSPEYNSAILTTNKVTNGDQKTSGLGGEDDDPLLWEAADLVVSNNFASTSTIQRKLSVGYARAGRIMDQLEQKGIVGPSNGSKPREVLVGVEELETLKAFDSLDD